MAAKPAPNTTHNRAYRGEDQRRVRFQSHSPLAGEGRGGGLARVGLVWFGSRVRLSGPASCRDRIPARTRRRYHPHAEMEVDRGASMRGNDHNTFADLELPSFIRDQDAMLFAEPFEPEVLSPEDQTVAV